MSDDWQDMASAPKNEPVLICPADCAIRVAIQREVDSINKPCKIWAWEGPDRSGSQYHTRYKPLSWRPIPLPPKHLYERKLTADLLEKQVKELRGENG